MDAVYLVKSVLAACALGCAALLFVAHRYSLPDVRRYVEAALWPLAGLSILAYASLGFPYAHGPHINTYDAYHYYLGAKYFNELGYLYLYDATIVAAHEDNSPLRQVGDFRDQSDYAIVPAQQAIAQQDRWRPNFTDARWESFKSDLAFFAPRMSIGGWRNALRDKGYNPPPVWTLTGSALAHAVPARPGTAIFLLMHADFLFVILMTAALAWAFNIETALLAAVFFGINYTTPYSAVGAAFLRLDWLMWLVFGICLMKRNLPTLSGMALAYAALLRLSPALYGAGLVAVAVRQFRETRRIPGWIVRFTIGGLVGTAILIGLTFAVMPEPVDAWRGFAEKMATHNESLGTKRFGLQYLFVWTGEVQRADLFTDNRGWEGYDARKLARLENLQWALRAAQGFLLGLFVVAASRKKPWEALTLGTILVFAFLAPTRYYYAQMIAFVPLLAYQWPNRRRFLGLILLFGMMIVAHAVHAWNDLLAFMQFFVSVEMLLFFLYLMLALIMEPTTRESDMTQSSGVTADGDLDLMADRVAPKKKNCPWRRLPASGNG